MVLWKNEATRGNRLGFKVVALGLEGAELLQGFFEFAREALAVHAEGSEGSDLFTQRFDDDGRRMGLGMFRDDFVIVLGEAESEQVIFERGDAVQSPGCVGEGLYELLLEDADGLEVVEELFREGLVGDEIL